MDYSNLRAAALRNAEDEEAVTVDTRALIDKVLARYSGEWTTLRELIQNAADAQATSVTVTWETLPSTSVPMPNTTDRSDQLKHVIANHTLRRLVVQNDGQPFNQRDWGRLKRIAEGNPDETKIGAFGVGFYSVFADCEEPFVSSGSEAMAFYWKGNSLFTKKSKLPEEQASKFTTFVLDYRNTTTPMPNLLSVGQFLATSLTFVALQSIEFKIDDYTILSLKKKTSPVVNLSLPKNLEPRTKEGLMKVVGVDRTSTQIDASFMSVIGWKPQSAAASKVADSFNSNEASSSLRSFFSRLAANASGAKSKAAVEENKVQNLISEDVTKIKTSSIFLRATSADVQTVVTSSFASELERATKKPPPAKTRLSILTASFDEAAASESASLQDGTGNATDVFASVLPNKKPGGRIFIGFPTMQTTGAGMHLSAPSVIPTVEREAIDLNARWVRTWNIELLRAAGIIVRLAFVNEMADLHKKVTGSVEPGADITEAIISKYLPEALHILGTYTFADSTPSSQVGQIMEEAFWTCFKKASIEMYSSRGVLQTSEVRLGIDELAAFVNSIPVVPKQMSDAPFVKKLIDFGLLTLINVGDIKKELGAKALSKAQVISLITWLGKKTVTGELDPASRSALLDVAVAAVDGGGSDGGSGEVILLGSITNYHSLARIPANMPIPPTTIPFSFTVNSSAAELQSLGWEPLEIVPWLRFLLETTNSRSEEESFTKSAKFAVQVLTILSKNWDTLSNASRNTITTVLQNRTVMPTKLGMKYPAEAFFPTVKLFDDLPIIQGCEKVKEKFLVAIGVRKTLDLETIFTRLLNTSERGGQQKWSHMELIKYLTSVQADIPSADMKKLKESKLCPAEAGPKGMEPTCGTTTLFKVSELFEPQETLRALKLPLLQWPGPPGSYRSNGAEALFLKSLGLRTFPSVPELVEMMASGDAALRANAMTYFITNHHLNMYGAFDVSTCRKPIIPLKDSNELVVPSACFTNPRVTVLGFSVLRPDLHDHANKFGVARDPPMLECVSRLLARPPRDHQSAVTLFGYFASRLSELGDKNLLRLRNAPIVPISRSNSSTTKEKGGGSLTFITPGRTYLGSSPTYDAIFDFVDFGNDANAFLFKCGARSEPTKKEVAEMACSEPARLLSALGNMEKYLNLLKSLAEESHILQRDKALWSRMQSSKFLPAYKEIATPTKGNLIDFEDEAEPVKQYQFATANQVVVLDDIVSYRLFKEHLICAPEEDLLEDFYIQLGAHRLSAMVEEDLRIGGRASKDAIAQRFRRHVIERTKIFLYEYAHYRRDFIKHDAKWLDSNLVVEVVRSVALRRTLKGQSQSHAESRSAAGSYTRGAWILYVADDTKPDMYQFGQAICQMLLKRPNQQAYLFFEPFLTLDLYALRDRGYNVDRILRVKAAEARMAEEEKRKALEEEQKTIREQEANRVNQGMIPEPQAAEAARAVPNVPALPAAPSTPAQAKQKLPGAWSSPEDNAPEPSNLGKKSRGLFSNLTKRLGLDTPSEEQPPPYTESEQRDRQRGLQGSSSGGADTGTVTSPTVVQQNLTNAVNATRAHGSSSVFSQPDVKEVKEQATYCDENSAKDIQHVSNAPNGLKIYTARHMSVDPQQFLSDNHDAVNAFANLLVDVGRVYGLSSTVLHIYYDERGNTIAFNTGGSIFCNLRFFLQLHAARVGPNGGSDGGAAWADAATWWWVVIAHELAHNLVTVHNSNHSYYTESFIQQYMGRMVTQITQWTQGGQ
ncbi:HATPase domain [Cordyceps militaris]|uniref:HATPase domain n=1 Tax=Cordyceps militaris TaxID=73501 RepID=A0A2H4SBX0_CORMI|nr:HATPase domain [Cordyceps militaris]